MKRRDKIFKVIETYLTARGYPDITNLQIMKELPGIFRILDRYDLIPLDMSYAQFHVIAQNEYIKARRKGFE